MEKPSKFYNSLHYPTTLLSILWIVLAVDTVSSMDLYIYGIYPRSMNGTIGIITAPLIHGSLSHILSNSAPLFVLMVMIFYFYDKIAKPVVLLIWILTGFSVWLLGREVYHIGASGVVYGLVAFVFWSGIFRRSVQSIILSLVVVFLYSGMFYGILPDQPGISWESHLFGALVGIGVAYWFRKEITKSEEENEHRNTNDDDMKPPTYFLNDDTFGHRYKRKPYDTDYEDLGSDKENRHGIW